MFRPFQKILDDAVDSYAKWSPPSRRSGSLEGRRSSVVLDRKRQLTKHRPLSPGTAITADQTPETPEQNLTPQQFTEAMMAVGAPNASPDAEARDVNMPDRQSGFQQLRANRLRSQGRDPKYYHKGEE
jgi:hypothetical protein